MGEKITNYFIKLGAVQDQIRGKVEERLGHQLEHGDELNAKALVPGGEGTEVSLS